MDDNEVVVVVDVVVEVVVVVGIAVELDTNCFSVVVGSLIRISDGRWVVVVFVIRISLPRTASGGSKIGLSVNG